MSHLVSTMKRVEREEQVAALDQPFVDPPPGVGTTVRFTLRAAEYRNGTNSFAALVTRSDPETGLISVVVVLGADDFMDQRDVPRKTEENGWGYELCEDPVAALRAEWEAYRSNQDTFKEELAAVLFGVHPKSEISVYDMILGIDAQFAAMIEAVPSRRQARKAKAKG